MRFDASVRTEYRCTHPYSYIFLHGDFVLFRVSHKNIVYQKDHTDRRRNTCPRRVHGRERHMRARTSTAALPEDLAFSPDRPLPFHNRLNPTPKPFRSCALRTTSAVIHELIMFRFEFLSIVITHSLETCRYTIVRDDENAAERNISEKPTNEKKKKKLTENESLVHAGIEV